MKASKLYGLHVITDSVLRPDRSHHDIAEAAIAGGASVIQYREKNRSTREMIEEAGRILEVCRRHGVLFLVNDRVDVALAVDADGVHLGQSDMPCRTAGRLLGAGRIIGISVGNQQEALEAEQDGADYLGVGPIFTTGSKADAGPAAGLDIIHQIKAVSRLPVVAIGGISHENISLVAHTKADAAAVISAVVCAEDMEKAVRQLTKLFNWRTE